MKFVFLFNEGDASMRNTLGGKGANLAEMTKLGLPVPEGFTISTDACVEYQETQILNNKLLAQINKAIKQLEKRTNKKFGGNKNPLLLSVRSGARVSMPGMMDSILNLGLNDEIVKIYAKETQNPRFAYDCYRRFIQMYSNVVHRIDSSLFETEIDALKKIEKVEKDQDFTVKHLQKLIAAYKKIFKSQTGSSFPQDVYKMLLDCVEGVFKSWNNERAILYRKQNAIPDDWGTAVNVQRMVFGNLNAESGTGVCFSRNPVNGENKFYGEFLLNAQGEDIVAGVRTPSPIENLKDFSETIYNELYGYAQKLEKVYHDMQDMEFTIENNKLFVLQTRNAKRTTLASIKVAVDLVSENLIDKETAVKSIAPEKLGELLTSSLNIPKELTPIAQGIAASPGGACGRIALSSEKATEFVSQKQKAILVRLETSADDISGMIICDGILTARGGTTSHAAVVARGMGRVCISGCEELYIKNQSIKIGKQTFKEGDYISLDGTTGNIYEGSLKTSSKIDNQDLLTLLSWAKELQKIEVLANADTLQDVRQAKKFAANGVGLCRTEHMFFNENRVTDMQKLILATDAKTRKAALKKLLTYQKTDFTQIFAEMQDLPVTIRLLDPPLHEFMPKTKSDLIKLAEDLKIDTKTLQKQIETLKETNPMMGHRGLRLAISHPEIYEMQVEAITISALKVQEKLGKKIVPEIMIPLTSMVHEFLFVKKLVQNTISKFDPENKLTYKIGTMIETPRACIVASDLASHCDFFSFGTNDLTQFTFGFSRDDAGKFLGDYQQHNILKQDVFMHIDQSAVGKMIENAIKSAKRVNPNLICGVCGEHAGDPESISFFKKIGVDYVSCSSARLAIATFASC